MSQITIYDIRNRVRNLDKTVIGLNESISLEESARKIIFSNNVSECKRFVESTKLKSGVSFSVYLDMLDTVAEHGTISDLNTIAEIITENSLSKTRDAKKTQTLLKRRLGAFRTKLKKFSPTSTKDKASVKKEEALISIYEKMLEKNQKNCDCDRIIENYNNISKRYNLAILFCENTRVNGVQDTMIQLCNLIETYSMPEFVKFNTIIETAWYGFESNEIPYKKSEVLETAIDYFAFKPDGLEACRKILESTILYDDEDMQDLDIFTEEEPEEDEPSEENKIRNDIDAYVNTEAVKVPKSFKVVKEAQDFKELFDKFKKEELPKDDKPWNKLKTLINKLYAKDVNSIVNDTPHLLSWIRGFFIVSTLAIPFLGPVLAAVGYIADRFIALHMNREETEKMLKCFANEIKATKTKISSTQDAETKKDLEQYLEALKNANDKIEMYNNSLYTDAEMEKKYEEMEDSEDDDFDLDDDSDGDSKDSGDFFDDDDFDFGDDDFLENSYMRSIYNNMIFMLEMAKNNPLTGDDMFNISKKMTDEDISNTSAIIARYPESFYRESFINGMQNELDEIRANTIHFESTIARVMRINTLNNAIAVCSNPIPVMEGTITALYQAKRDMSVVNNTIYALTLIRDNAGNESNLLEASFSNTLKMASMKIREAMKKMSDKEKSISRAIDNGVNSFKKAMENATTNDNREAIIKGSLLPSASKLIKAGIVNAGLIGAGAALSQPILAVVAVIGSLGYIAMSIASKNKERQMVVDELEIELKMCRKYIEIAESKNDMKALKELLTIQRNLERQLQRIKYKMKVELGQKVYDTSSAEPSASN